MSEWYVVDVILYIINGILLYGWLLGSHKGDDDV